MSKVARAVLVVALVAVLAPAAAQAKAKLVPSVVIADVAGVIDRHGSVSYLYGGGVGAKGLNFKCMERRQVSLFHLDSNGTPTLVASTRTDFLGSFNGKLERPLEQIQGYYYAEVAPHRVKSKSGKFNCLGARSETFLVQVPSGLLNSG